MAALAGTCPRGWLAQHFQWFHWLILIEENGGSVSRLYAFLMRQVMQ